LPASSAGNSMCCPQEAQMLLAMAGIEESLSEEGYALKVNVGCLMPKFDRAARTPFCFKR
jgi:hypothetical protein